LYLTGRITGGRIVEAIDFPTSFILFGLMILSAQFAVSGFYDWCSAQLAAAAVSPARLLAGVIAVSGLLSAVLANDVVVFAMTPLLCRGIQARGFDPRPYLIALAGAANAGSAATMIGNPQNILIAPRGGLEFWRFAGVCAVPAVLGLLSVLIVVWLAWRKHLQTPPTLYRNPDVAMDRYQLRKAIVATVILLLLFAAPVPHETGVLAVAATLLVSRHLASRRMLGMVDWHLLVLFGSLFVVTESLAAGGLLNRAVAALNAWGVMPERLEVIAPLALVGSNTLGNVPAVILFLSAWPTLPESTLYALAVLSTLAGNLLLVGSLANLIVVERAREVGVTLGLAEHARCGIPMTLLSCAGACAWLWLASMIAWT
jgi:Na+/H+ antiporter NhaD/arsenite permease-like protein